MKEYRIKQSYKLFVLLGGIILTILDICLIIYGHISTGGIVYGIVCFSYYATMTKPYISIDENSITIQFGFKPKRINIKDIKEISFKGNIVHFIGDGRDVSARLSLIDPSQRDDARKYLDGLRRRKKDNV